MRLRRAEHRTTGASSVSLPARIFSGRTATVTVTGCDQQYHACRHVPDDKGLESLKQTYQPCTEGFVHSKDVRHRPRKRDNDEDRPYSKLATCSISAASAVDRCRSFLPAGPIVRRRTPPTGPQTSARGPCVDLGCLTLHPAGHQTSSPLSSPSMCNSASALVNCGWESFVLSVRSLPGRCRAHQVRLVAALALSLAQRAPRLALCFHNPGFLQHRVRQ
jgi:hypothetical protein